MSAVEHYVGNDWRRQTHVAPVVLDPAGRILCVQFLQTSVWRLPEWPLYVGQDTYETASRAARWQVGAIVTFAATSGSSSSNGPAIVRQVIFEGQLIQRVVILPVMCRLISCVPWDMPTAIDARRWIDPHTHNIRDLDPAVVEVGNRLRRL